MNKGRIITKAILARLSLSAAVLWLCAPVAFAQQGNPEIYIDMGVLQGVGDAPPAPAPVKLRPPVPRPAQEQGLSPRLTTPVAPPTERMVTPPAPAPAAPPAIVQPPLATASSLPVPQTMRPETVSKAPEIPPDKLPQRPAPPPTAEAPAPAPAKVAPAQIQTPPPPLPAPVEATIVETPTIFPVETRVRQETNDPADSDSSRPIPVRSGITGNTQDVDVVVPSRPLPDMDPAVTPPTPPATTTATATGKTSPFVPARKPQATAVSVVKAEAKTEALPLVPPLVPGRRPDFIEKAPAELVAELRAREAARETDEAAKKASRGDAPPKRAIDLNDPPPPPGPRGQKNMPAVKKAAVEAEAIAEQVVRLPAEKDPLLDSLVEKDKESLVATIESIVAAREDGKPLPAAVKPPRDTGSNIVRAEPMQRPYNVYRPHKKDKDESVVASLPPPEKSVAPQKPAAVSVGPRPPPPQAQDEQAYVSVLFGEGLTEIDATITAEIEKRILPILNQNPGWKLQIQAFASPVKDGASSARKASLARALSVRTYLLGKGVDATRMDVRALGAESDRDPMDRVDLIVFDPARRG